MGEYGAADTMLRKYSEWGHLLVEVCIETSLGQVKVHVSKGISTWREYFFGRGGGINTALSMFVLLLIVSQGTQTEKGSDTPRTKATVQCLSLLDSELACGRGLLAADAHGVFLLFCQVSHGDVGVRCSDHRDHPVHPHRPRVSRQETQGQGEPGGQVLLVVRGSIFLWKIDSSSAFILCVIFTLCFVLSFQLPEMFLLVP